MKNFIFRGAFVALFCTLFSSFSFAKHFDGGGELALIIAKQNPTTVYFNIPSVYLAENGSFMLPLQVKIVKDSKIVTEIVILDSGLVLPENDWQNGSYDIEISIGKYTEKKRINL